MTEKVRIEIPKKIENDVWQWVDLHSQKKMSGQNARHIKRF